MALNEALYERKLCTPLCWEEVKDKGFFGLKLIQETIAKIREIQEKMKKEKDFHKSHTNRHIRPLEFDMGDHVVFMDYPSG